MRKDLSESVAEICLALPEATREVQGDHSTYRVRKKPFAYLLRDHHGDGITSVCCKVLPGDNAELVRADPVKFYLPAYIGSRGWVGLRLDLAEAPDWAEVAELVRGSYLLAAPKIVQVGTSAYRR